MPNPPPLIDSLKQAAQAAGAILLEGYHATAAIELESKGASDFVTPYDRAAENAIIDTICRAHPNVGFLGEETGATPARGGEITVILDPLDGTNNFLHRLPHFSVSIAVQEGDALTHGVVYQPLLDEMLWAEHSQGAYVGTRCITAPPARALHEMLATS